MITSRLRRGRPVAVLALAVATAVGLSACGSGSSGGGGPKTVNLVAYSVPKPAYDALATAFGKTSRAAASRSPPRTAPAAPRRPR